MEASQWTIERRRARARAAQSKLLRDKRAASHARARSRSSDRSRKVVNEFYARAHRRAISARNAF